LHHYSKYIRKGSRGKPAKILEEKGDRPQPIANLQLSKGAGGAEPWLFTEN
jgi:hypothetical protein